MKRTLCFVLALWAMTLSAMAQTELPARYDMRETGWLPEVRSQGQSSSCWIFGAVSAVESNMIRKGLATQNLDYSEKQWAYFAKTRNTDTGDGNDEGSPFGSGGNQDLAIKALACHMGVTTEARCPFENLETYPEEELRYKAATLLRGAHEVAFADRESVKRALLQYGGACAGIWMETGSYMNGAAYFCYDSKPTNHLITLVGWDDNYAVSNFSPDHQPQTPGAWIFRNSWGTAFADGGYFYVSYEDKSLWNCYLYDMQPADEKEHFYQYDGRGWNKWLSFDAVCNVFTAQSHEWLSEIGVFNAGNTSTTFSVYLFDAASEVSDPEAGTLAGTWTFPVTAWYGRYTLPTPVELQAGQKFAIVQTVSGGQFAMEQKLTDAQIEAGYKDNTAHAGETFMKSGDTWTDCTTSAEARNACIKAFTRTEARPATYDVTFNGNATGVTGVPQAQAVGYMGTATQPDANPERHGYVFRGWYRNMECTDAWKFDAYAVTGHTTLYAGWTSLQAESIELPSAIAMPPSSSRQVAYSVQPASAADAPIAWSSSNDAVVSVNDAGVLTAGSAAGEAIITATSGSATAEMKAVVCPTFNIAAADVSVSTPGTYYVYGDGKAVANTFQITAAGDYELYLKNVHISKDQPVGEGGIFDCGAASNVTMHVLGSNTLENTFTTNNPPGGDGLTSPRSGTMTLVGDGTLTTKAGAGGAGVSVGANAELTIDMDGGRLYAYGGKNTGYAAGIGGVNKDGTTTKPKKITIKRGYVYVQGGRASAGIGAIFNNQPDAGFLTVTGGSVYVRGGDYAESNWFGGGMYKEQVFPVNSRSETLTTAVIPLGSSLAGKRVEEITVYSTNTDSQYGNGMTTDGEGKLYLLLPPRVHGVRVKAAGRDYYFTVTPTGTMISEATAAEFTPAITASKQEVRYDEAFTLTPEAENYTGYALSATEDGRLVTGAVNASMEATVPQVGVYSTQVTARHSATGLPVAFPAFTLTVYNNADGTLCRATRTDPLHLGTEADWQAYCAALADAANVPCQGVLLTADAHLVLDNDVADASGLHGLTLTGCLDGAGHVLQGGMTDCVLAENQGTLTNLGVLQTGIALCAGNRGTVRHSFATGGICTGENTGSLLNCHTATADDLTSGALTCALTLGGAAAWGQRIGSDVHPVPMQSGNRVYSATVYAGNGTGSTQYLNADANGLLLTGNALAYVTGISLDVPNTVTDGLCPHLQLTDRETVCVPQAFRATKVTYSRNMPAEANWGTGFLPFEVTGDGLYVLDDIKDGALHVKKVESVPANTPFLFQTKADSYDVEQDNAEIALTTATNEGEAHASYALTGTYERMQLATGAMFIYNDLFYKVDSEVWCLPFRAYLANKGTGTGLQSLRIVADAITGIEDVLDDVQPAAPDDVYGLDGRKVGTSTQHLPRGIYLVGGKKLIR